MMRDMNILRQGQLLICLILSKLSLISYRYAKSFVPANNKWRIIMIQVSAAPVDTYIVDIEYKGPFTTVRLFLYDELTSSDLRVYHTKTDREFIAIPCLEFSGYIDSDDTAEQCLARILTDKTAKSIQLALDVVSKLQKWDISLPDTELKEFPPGTIPHSADYLEYHMWLTERSPSFFDHTISPY